MGTITYQGVSTSTSSGGSGGGGASGEELAAIALQAAQAEAEAQAASAVATSAQQSVANLSGEVADRPTTTQAEEIAAEAVAGVLDVAEETSGAIATDALAFDAVQIALTGDGTLSVANADSISLLKFFGVLLSGTGTLTPGTGFAPGIEPIEAAADEQVYVFRRVGSALSLATQPPATALAVDTGTAYYDADDIAVIDADLMQAEADILAVQGEVDAVEADVADHETRIGTLEAGGAAGTDKVSRFALAASLGLYADTDAAAADLATMTEGTDYVVQDTEPDGSETAPLIIKNNYA